MTNTRTLASEQEKCHIKAIPFFSCGKTSILVAIAGGIVQFSVSVRIYYYHGMYLLGMTSAIVAIIILKYYEKSKVSPFIMELPNYHLPQFKIR